MCDTVGWMLQINNRQCATSAREYVPCSHGRNISGNPHHPAIDSRIALDIVACAERGVPVFKVSVGDPIKLTVNAADVLAVVNKVTAEIPMTDNSPEATTQPASTP